MITANTLIVSSLRQILKLRTRPKRLDYKPLKPYSSRISTSRLLKVNLWPTCSLTKCRRLLTLMLCKNPSRNWLTQSIQVTRKPRFLRRTPKPNSPRRNSRHMRSSMVLLLLLLLGTIPHLPSILDKCIIKRVQQSRQNNLCLVWPKLRRKPQLRLKWPITIPVILNLKPSKAIWIHQVLEALW
jgi:hypothetical protein